MQKFYKIKNSLPFSLFPYNIDENKYKLLLKNFYPACSEEIPTIDKKKKIVLVKLKTEQGNLFFRKCELKQISEKEYKDLEKEFDKNYILKHFDPEKYPYFETPFIYVELVENKTALKPIKRVLIDEDIYLLVRNPKNYEEYLVKEEDLEKL